MPWTPLFTGATHEASGHQRNMLIWELTRRSLALLFFVLGRWFPLSGCWFCGVWGTWKTREGGTQKEGVKVHWRRKRIVPLNPRNRENKRNKIVKRRIKLRTHLRSNKYKSLTLCTAQYNVRLFSAKTAEAWLPAVKVFDSVGLVLIGTQVCLLEQ